MSSEEMERMYEKGRLAVEKKEGQVDGRKPTGADSFGG